MSYFKLKILDGDELNAGTMYCIGQNYARHAAEMGSSVSENPTVFIKPPSAYIPGGEKILLPDFSGNIHHEVELVVLIGRDCHIINKNNAHQYIAGYAIGIDVTLRDLQQKAKNEGKPWSVAKGFYTSAPISEFVPQQRFGSEIPFFDLKLWVNDELRQTGNTSEMERTVAELVQYLAGVFTLRKGDLIFTGTPEGVGQIKSGDVVKAQLQNFVDISVGVD